MSLQWPKQSFGTRGGVLFGNTVAVAGPCGPGFDPVDHLTTLWTNKMGLQGGFGGKRSCALWMSESLVLLQLDPLDHHFDPEDQVPTLWISAN